jgi:O-antigen/teichoic acid export membrane protein
MKHTAIYSLGNIATKLIGIVLLPLYTTHITVAEYGVLGILEITIMILTQVLILGQSQAFLRFHDLEGYKERRKSTLFTIFIFLFATGLLINIVGQSCTSKLSSLFSKPTDFAVYFRLCFVIIFLRIINNLFLSVLRANEKSIFYAIANTIKFIIILGFNIYFVAFAKIGIKGILYSYLIGDGVLFLILFPGRIFEMAPKFDSKIFKAAFVFGFPLIFSSLAHMLLNMGNRYILKLLVNYEEVGLYNLGYKVAGVLNMFFIQSFTLGLLPSAYKMYGKKGDKRYYSKMLTYFVFVLCWAGLGLSLFSAEIVKILSPNNSDYWSAHTVIPIIVLSYIFSGAKSVTALGMYLKGKTQFIAYITALALFINIALNFLFIPKHGMMGAAYATLIAFIALYFLSYSISDRLYKIPFENLKLLKLILLTIALYYVSVIFQSISLPLNILLKIAILVSFPFILYVVNFYEKIELETIKKGFLKLTKLG